MFAGQQPGLDNCAFRLAGLPSWLYPLRDCSPGARREKTRYLSCKLKRGFPVAHFVVVANLPPPVVAIRVSWYDAHLSLYAPPWQPTCVVQLPVYVIVAQSSFSQVLVVAIPRVGV